MDMKKKTFNLLRPTSVAPAVRFFERSSLPRRNRPQTPSFRFSILAQDKIPTFSHSTLTFLLGRAK